MVLSRYSHFRSYRRGSDPEEEAREEIRTPELRMDGAAQGMGAYVLGPRVPTTDGAAVEAPSAVLGYRGPSRVLPRDSATGTASSNPCDSKDASSQYCEKPADSQSGALPISLGVIIPLVAIIAVLTVLHYRAKRRMRDEDVKDPHRSLDFGLEENFKGKGAKSNRKSMLGASGGMEKEGHSRYRQMSMDLNLSNPYLLPPALHSSRESLHSLARSMHQNEDPYRPVTALSGDGGSIRAPSRGPDGGSMYSRDSGRMQRRSLLGPGAPRTPTDPSFTRPPPMLPPISTASSVSSAKDPFRSPSELSVGSSPYRDEADVPDMRKLPEVQNPAPVALGLREKSSPPPQASESVNELAGSVVQHSRIRSQQAVIHEREPSAAELDTMRPTSHAQQPAALPLSPQAVESLSVAPESQVSAPILEEPTEHHDGYAQMPQANYEPQEYDGYDDNRGRSHHRQSSYYEEPPAVALGVPQQDNHRLSVGFRPLPPDDLLTDTEDPETRANRIRSFYKEYFDDTKDPNRQTQFMPPVPPLNPQQHQSQNRQAGTDYYEDYDQHYTGGGDEAYYDPNANAFVMPYAQPVARRAMTPPPSGSRFQGPRAPPRGFHGSMGDMNMGMPGMRGPPRPGSSASRQYGPPRAGTSMSGAWGRPRAGSALSAYGQGRANSSLSAYGQGRNGPPKKPLPPPAALSTLPTPSKLRDDTFAIFNAADFAPPETFKDRVAGRSQSPIGERKPYQMTVPAHSPLVNAFEEMPALPSPHLLRKSGTFTSLDFAPPRKFVDANDSRSDAGSIRSNRSGISAVQLGAIRNGAGRVSRLPGDTIFTPAAMQEVLKPEWSMHR